MFDDIILLQESSFDKLIGIENIIKLHKVLSVNMIVVQENNAFKTQQVQRKGKEEENEGTNDMQRERNCSWS